MTDIVDPPWLVIARKELGVKEARGTADNPRVVEYHKTTKGPHHEDEVSWCSSFVNWTITQAGMKGTDLKAARSWLTWGVETKARRGAICVLWRKDPKGPFGHVGFLISETDREVTLLGGNQANAVAIHSYPKARVLGFRWPASALP